MAGPITERVRNLLLLNDEYITDPLLNNQQRHWIGTPYAFAQTLTSAITAVATAVFALLASSLGLICKVVGLKEVGEDLIQSANLAFMGTFIDRNPCRGTLNHLAAIIVSLVNGVSCAFALQWAKRELEALGNPSSVSELIEIQTNRIHALLNN